MKLKAADILGPAGRIAARLSAYEERPQQLWERLPVVIGVGVQTDDANQRTVAVERHESHRARVIDLGQPRNERMAGLLDGAGAEG